MTSKAKALSRWGARALAAWLAAGALGTLLLFPLLATRYAFAAPALYWLGALIWTKRLSARLRGGEGPERAALETAQQALSVYLVAAPLGAAGGLLWVFTAGSLRHAWLAVGVPVAFCALLAAAGALTSARGAGSALPSTARDRAALAMKLLLGALGVTYGPALAVYADAVGNYRTVLDLPVLLGYTLAVLSLAPLIALATAVQEAGSAPKGRLLLSVAVLLCAIALLGSFDAAPALVPNGEAFVPAALAALAAFELGYWESARRKVDGQSPPTGDGLEEPVEARARAGVS